MAERVKRITENPLKAAHDEEELELVQELKAAKKCADENFNGDMVAHSHQHDDH